jgi:hypothetical protein
MNGEAREPDTRGTWLAWGAVVLVTLWMAIATPVISEEAYYWMFAERLDWSYFDHPPLCAWLIRVGTTLFGDNALGIRFGTVLCALATTWIAGRWLRELGADRATQRWWILASLGIPAFIAGHVLATPDTPLVLAYIACAYALWRARAKGELRWWLAAGFAAGCALLAKYSAVFLALGGVILLLFDAPLRRQLLSPGPWVAVILAVVVFTPVLYWNHEHDWISFTFQTADRYAARSFSIEWPLTFLGAQIGLMSPVLAWLLVPALLWAWRTCRSSDENLRYLLAFGVPMPLFLTLNSFAVQPKIHWALPAFVPLAMLLFLWWRRTEQRTARPLAKRLGLASLAVAWLACVAAPAIAFLPQKGGANWSGCDQIAERAAHWADTEANASAAGHGVFFFTDNHRDSAQLFLGLTTLPQPPKFGTLVLASEAFGRRGRQFDIWSRPEQLVGWSAVFAQIDPDGRTNKLERANDFFDEVRPVERLEIVKLGRTVQTVQFFVCRGYRGPHASQ